MGLERIARLRRAQQRLPGNRDIAAVRAELERELGATVSRRLAARLLGVSHTALARWIAAGDLPVVFSSNGRQEMPVPALLDLYEKVGREREQGGRSRHVLEAALSEGRDRARRLSAPDLVAGTPEDDGGHGPVDRRGLAYHRALASHLSRRMINEALHRVWKWHAEGKLDPRYAAEWEQVLRRPLAEVRDAITEDSARGRDLRQNSPFAGMLSEPERRRILEVLR